MKGIMVVLLIAGTLVGCGSKAPLQEDDPGWDCRTMGNRICGSDYY